MNEDIRISTTIQEHPKFRALRKTLGDAGALSLIFLWCFCGRSAPSGILEGMDATDVAEAAGWRGKPEVFVQTLLDLRLLDKKGTTYSVHNWIKHNLYASAAPIRSRIARANVAKRWHKKTKLLEQDNTVGNTDGNTPSPPPSPSPRREGGGEAREVGPLPLGGRASSPLSQEPPLTVTELARWRRQIDERPDSIMRETFIRVWKRQIQRLSPEERENLEALLGPKSTTSLSTLSAMSTPCSEAVGLAGSPHSPPADPPDDSPGETTLSDDQREEEGVL